MVGRAKKLSVVPSQIEFDHDQILDQIERVAGEVMRSPPWDSKNTRILMLAVLNGAVPFALELARNIWCKVDLRFIDVRPSNQDDYLLRAYLPFDSALVGKSDILLVDDVLDSGATLSFLQRKLTSLKPRSLRTAVLLRKRSKRRWDPDVNFVGLEVADRYYFGYGMDIEGCERELVDIYSIANKA